MNAICEQVHRLFGRQERFSFPFDEHRIPRNGIYALFEKGETGHGTDRIVRIGTHTGDNQLRSRLKQHFLKENKDRSIFRKNIGRALLYGEGDPFLEQWNLDLTTRKAKNKYSSTIDWDKQNATEKRVSQYIQGHFTFAVGEVTDKPRRMVLESRLISTVSLCNDCGPSATWLGLSSPKQKIRESGLWLVNELYKQPLSEVDLSEASDANVLHDLADALDSFVIYSHDQVDAFNELFFGNAEAEQLSPILDTVAASFAQIEDEKVKIDCKIKAKQFAKLYPQMAAIISFENVEWEKLYWFLKFLIPKLKVENPTPELDELLESVDLDTYALERGHLTAIPLDANDSELNPANPNVRGYHDPPEELNPLDKIVKEFNERHFAGWDATPEQQKVKLIHLARQVVTDPKYVEQVQGSIDKQNRQMALSDLIDQKIKQSRREELSLYKRYAGDTDFKKAMIACIVQMIDHPQVFEELSA